MEVVSGSCANHLISKLNAPTLALIAAFSVLGPADIRAEAPDALAGESCGFACGVGLPDSELTLLAAHWPSAKASAASRDPFGVTLLAAHWPSAKASAASRDPFGVTLLAAHWPSAKASAASRDPFGVTLLAAHWPSAKASAASRDPFGVTLLGAWHVLVHYVDAASSGAERERWDDRAWVFEAEGDRLRWTEYPIVVFDDETGRFEKDGANLASRIPHHWQPDEAQLADIQDGLAVNERGMSTATLRRSEGSWVSKSDWATVSASVIRYVETWRVDPAVDGPIFVREDALRSERAEDLSGVTIYTTREAKDGRRLLRGDFERDGTQHGTFTMTRAAGVHGYGN
jgi:hypothetical protein